MPFSPHLWTKESGPKLFKAPSQPQYPWCILMTVSILSLVLNCWHEHEGVWASGSWGCSLGNSFWGRGGVHGFPPSDFTLVEFPAPMCEPFSLTSHRERQVHDSQWNYMSQAAGKHTLAKDQQSHWLFIRCLSQAINQERQWLQPLVRTCNQVNHGGRGEHWVLTQSQRSNWCDMPGMRATIWQTTHVPSDLRLPILMSTVTMEESQLLCRGTSHLPGTTQVWPLSHATSMSKSTSILCHIVSTSSLCVAHSRCSITTV